jgi:hypothetical protein
MLSVQLGQFERCICAVVALHVFSAAMGFVMHTAADRSALLQRTSLEIHLLGWTLAGLLCWLARPWLSCWLGKGKPAGGWATADLRIAPTALESSLLESPALLEDWQIIKAIGLIATAALMAGSLFLNWYVIRRTLGQCVAALEFSPDLVKR